MFQRKQIDRSPVSIGLRWLVAAMAVVWVAAAGGNPAIAENAKGLTTEQVVEALVNSADLGVARGLCIGRVEKCLSTLEKASGTEMIVTFELDSAQLTEEARGILQLIAEALGEPRLQQAKIVVEGYADAVGPAWYNKRLSRQRARTVATFLLANGLEKKRVSIVGVGEVEAQSEDEFNPSDRRVEVRIRN